MKTGLIKLTNNKKVAAVLLAAGPASRFNQKIPKQYARANGRELFLYALFPIIRSKLFTEIVCVVKRDWRKRAEAIVRRHFDDRRIHFVYGAFERKGSIGNALRYLKNKSVDYVLFHDAARPFATTDLIERVAKNSFTYGAAIAGIRVADPPVVVEDNVAIKRPPKNSYFATQTPECYRYDLILKAHEKSLGKKELQKATNLELMVATKTPVHFVQHDERNLKITYPSDLKLARGTLWNNKLRKKKTA